QLNIKDIYVMLQMQLIRFHILYQQ
ncbi:hypothetical protein ACTFIU_001763, partial [Dictyostelium citrinum]